MNLPDAAVERLLRNALDLNRVHRAIARDSSGVLRQLFDDLAAEIARIDPTGVGPMTYRRARVEKLLARVEALTGEAFGDWHKQVRADLARLGRQQGHFTTQLLRVALADAADIVRPFAPTQNMVRSILDTNPFRGETLKGWAEVQEAATVRRVRQQIQIGMMQEASIDDMVRAIRGKSDGRGGFTGGVMETSSREASAIARTAVTDIANTAALQTYEQNRRVTTAYEWVSTLDSRTSEVCLARSGQVFRYDDPKAPKPPAHFNCRSFIVAVVDWERLGIDPPEPGMRAARDTETGKRTQVAADISMDEWLKAQPVGVQEEMLGVGKARLFRDGKITLADLIRQDGSVLTLAELEARTGV